MHKQGGKMNEKDKREKLLEDYNDVFADIYNTLLFKKQVLDEKCLDFGQTESIYKLDNEELKDQRRDVLKKYNDTNLIVLSMGIENQTKSDKTMPFRIMSYDVGTYMGYVKNKMPVYPVITIVLNFSATKWNCGTSLHEALDIPTELKPYVSDYNFHVFDIAYLEDSVIDRFKSDFKLVAKIFKEKRLGKNDTLRNKTDAIQHVEELLGMLKALTGDKRYDYTDTIREIEAKGEPIYMCTALDGIIKEATINVHIQYLSKKATTIDDVKEKTGLSEEEIQQRLKELDENESESICSQ